MLKKTHFTVEAKKNIGKTITVGGWVHYHRVLGKLIFVKLRDSKGIIQITAIKNKTKDDIFKALKELTFESVILVKGKVKKSDQAEGGVEVIPKEVEVLSKADVPLPLPVSNKTPVHKDTIFEHREISIRMPKYQKLLKIKSETARYIREFLTKKDFTEIFTPYIVSTATEGGAELFKVDYFGKNAYLAQSAQFYKQAAISTHEKVFGIIPAWRAEKSRTNKHITEFHTVEIEKAFSNEKEIMNILEELIVYIFKKINKSCKEELKFLNRKLKIPKLPFKRYDFYDVKNKLIKQGVENNLNDDFTTPGETKFSEEHSEPFFIINYPKNLRGMYYKSKEKLSLTFDLIAPEGFGELATGGARVNSYEELVKKIKAKNLPIESFSWYLNLFKYGMPPHAGCGLGFERLVRWITGVKDIKDIVMFPRTPDILKP